jgi:hypothetical protein
VEASSNRAHVAVERRTRGVEVLDQILPHSEEHVPIPGRASVAGLVASVFAELTQTAAAVGALDRGLAKEPLHAGVCFARVALAAVTAIPRIHPDLKDDSPIRAKDKLLDLVDEDVDKWIDESGLWETACPAFWLQATAALLYGAADGVIALQGWGDGSGDDEGRLLEGEPSETCEISEAISDSLLQVAEMATAATQWFEQASNQS